MTESLGQRMKRILSKRAMTQTQLAIRSGVDRSTLNRILNDKRVPSADELGWIATALETTVEDLMEEVAVTEPLRRRLGKMTELGRELLEARAQADGARAAAREATEQFDTQAAEHAKRVEQLEVEVADARRDKAEGIAAIERQAHEREHRMRSVVAQRDAEIRQLRGRVATAAAAAKQADERARQAEKGALGKALLGSGFAFLLGKSLGGTESDEHYDD